MVKKPIETPGFVDFNPLVLKIESLNFYTSTVDRDRTVLRRSKPNSRTTLIGEQPNPWNLFSPRMWWVDIEVPNDSVDKDSWESSACYPRRTFYPLSDGPSIRNHRITMTDLRPCSTCQSYSQANLYHYALTIDFQPTWLPSYASVTL